MLYYNVPKTDLLSSSGYEQLKTMNDLGFIKLTDTEHRRVIIMCSAIAHITEMRGGSRITFKFKGEIAYLSVQETLPEIAKQLEGSVYRQLTDES